MKNNIASSMQVTVDTEKIPDVMTHTVNLTTKGVDIMSKANEGKDKMQQNSSMGPVTTSQQIPVALPLIDETKPQNIAQAQ